MKKIVLVFLSAVIFANSFFFPTDAYAFNLFRELRNTVRFVVNLPDKATRFLGPVLGPVASTVLTKNLLKHNKLGSIFRKAHKADRVIQDIEKVKDQVNLVRNVYKDQAKEMRAQAAKLEEARKKLAAQMVKDKDYTFDEFKSDVVSIQNLIEIYNTAADKFDSAASQVGPEDIVKIVGENFLQQALGHVKEAVIFEASAELEKFVDPNIISRFLDNKTGAGGLDAVLDFFVARELGDGAQGMSDEERDAFIERVKQRIKESINKDAEDFKQNWRERMNELVQKELEKVKEEGKDKIKEVEKTAEEQEQEKEAEIPAKNLGGDERCGPGYEYNVRFANCVQAQCNNVPNAHYSYEGYCVCGSSGSIAENPKDPNIECHYPPDYESCPSCVYACMHLNEECPKP